MLRLFARLTAVLGLALGFSAIASARGQSHGYRRRADDDLRSGEPVRHAGGDQRHHTGRRRLQARDELPRRACSEPARWRRARRHTALCRQRRLCRNASRGAPAGAEWRGRVSGDRAGRRAVAAAQAGRRRQRGAVLPGVGQSRACAHHAGAVAIPGRPHRGRRAAGQALSDDCSRRCRRTTRRGADTPCSKRTARSATR